MIDEKKLIEKLFGAGESEKSLEGLFCEASSVLRIINNMPQEEPERPKGRWEWKHRMKGGFHTYTGVDSMGETHTITVDERHETEEPYCPICGKWNDSQWLDFCPNCGSDNG